MSRLICDGGILRYERGDGGEFEETRISGFSLGSPQGPKISRLALTVSVLQSLPIQDSSNYH